MTGWAVVTGASSGLGEGYATRLATQGANLRLVARSADRLEGLAERLRSTHRVAVTVSPCDLTDRPARAELIDQLRCLEIHTLVNNAGFGSLGPFTELPSERISAEVELNVVALTELTRAVLPGMRSRGRGAVINIASTGAFQPIPRFATYAATKAYVLRLSVALWAELRDTDVRVLAVCPGPTDTAFFDRAGDDMVMSRRRSVEQVVDTSFKALRRRQPYVVDGLRNSLLAEATRFVPTGLATRLAAWVASH
ncbi:MAG: SDR family oxidoreductase [Propionibacteriaceae bacterium]|nr:SDR family oxidoreductase [Propionibacteriaceae bacterium]